MAAPAPSGPPVSAPPPLLKPIAQYLQRAAQLDSADAVMAYHCRMYAAQKGLGIHAKQTPQNPEVKKFLVGLLDKLEADKKEISVLLSQEDMRQKHAASFALRVFKLADDSDRAGQADKSTVKNFMAASSFFDVTTQFGELPEELKKMNKYAKWRATEIGKALRDGTPIPAPPSGTSAPGEGAVEGEGTDAAMPDAAPHAGGPSPSIAANGVHTAAPPPASSPSLPPSAHAPATPSPPTQPAAKPAAPVPGPPPAFVEQPTPQQPPAPLYDPMEDLASQLPPPPGSVPPRSANHQPSPPPAAAVPPPSAPVPLANPHPTQPYALRISFVAKLRRPATFGGFPSHTQSVPTMPSPNPNSFFALPPTNPYAQPPALQHNAAFPSKGVADFMPPNPTPTPMAHSPQQHRPPPQQHQAPPPAAAHPAPAPAAAKPPAAKQPRTPQIIYNPNDYIPLNYNIVNGYTPPSEDLIQAEKYSRYAASALQFEDVPAAIKNLILALNLLTGQAPQRT